MFFRRGSPWSVSSNQAENRLLQYPPTDRGNGENQTPLPTSPDVDNSSGTTPNMSSIFALGTIDRLLDRARGGEAEALSTLYHHFFPGVFSYITSHTSDRATAEDLTSEVFLKMVEHIHQVKASDEVKFSAWLLRVTKFTVAGYYRKREKQPTLVSLESTLREDDDTYEERYAIDASDPALCWEERDEWNVVMQAINMLTEEQRHVVIHRLILGYDVATVARMTGKKANAIKALQFRALQSLQRLLAEKAQPQKIGHATRQQEGAL